MLTGSPVYRMDWLYTEFGVQGLAGLLGHRQVDIIYRTVASQVRPLSIGWHWEACLSEWVHPRWALSVADFPKQSADADCLACKKRILWGELSLISWMGLKLILVAVGFPGWGRTHLFPTCGNFLILNLLDDDSGPTRLSAQWKDKHDLNCSSKCIPVSRPWLV